MFICGFLTVFVAVYLTLPSIVDNETCCGPKGNWISTITINRTYDCACIMYTVKCACMYIVYCILYGRVRQSFVLGGPKMGKLGTFFAEGHLLMLYANLPKFFLMTFFAPRNLKRARFGPWAIGWRPLLYSMYSVHYNAYDWLFHFRRIFDLFIVSCPDYSVYTFVCLSVKWYICVRLYDEWLWSLALLC